MQPEEMIGIWDSAPYDFGATESTKLALLPDGSGWTSVTGPSATGQSATGTSAAAAAPPSRVRHLSWDCPRTEVLEIRYDDYEFVRAQYKLLTDALQLSQHLDSARQFALTRHQVAPDEAAPAPAAGDEVPGAAPRP